METFDSFIANEFEETRKQFDSDLQYDVSHMKTIFETELQPLLKASAFKFFASNANKEVHLFKLSDDVLYILFRYLSNAEVYSLRSVSQRMKQIAEWVLGNRKHCTIDHRVRSESQLVAICNLFRNVTKLTLTQMIFSSATFAFSANGKFTNVTTLTIERYESNRIELMADCFPNVESVTLCGPFDSSGNVYANESVDESVATFLSKLTKLRKIVLFEFNITSFNCLCKIGAQVESITCSGLLPTAKASRFNDQLSIKYLEYKINDQDITRRGADLFAILKQMKKLKILKFSMDHTFKTGLYEQLSQLRSLEDLSLHLRSLPEQMVLSQKFEKVKILLLELQFAEVSQFSQLFRYFSAVENLTICLAKDSDLGMNSIFNGPLVSLLRQLKSLKYFTYEDRRCIRSRYVELEQNQYHLPDTIEQIDFIENVAFVFHKGYPYLLQVERSDSSQTKVKTFESFCSELIASVRLIAQRRPTQQFALKFHSKRLDLISQLPLCTDIPTNLKIKCN